MASARIVPVLLALMSLALAGGDEGPLPRLVVTTADGVVLVDAPLPDDRAWRMEWVHSVARVTVVDTFAYEDGVVMVTGQITPHLDIAGLGAFAGRGTVERLPDGRYWLRGIDLPLPGNVHAIIIGTERAPSTLVVGDERFELTRLRPGEHARPEVLTR